MSDARVSRWWSVGHDAVLALVIVMLTLTCITSSVSTHFGGGPPTSGEIAEFWIPAAAAILLSVGGIVVGIVRASYARAIIFAVLGIVVTVNALLLSVPKLDLERDPPEVSENYVPCFSGSNDCPGR